MSLRRVALLAEMRKAKQTELQMGIKVEAEHKDAYDLFERYLKKNNVPMPIDRKDFYKVIAEAHLEEDKKYYTKLLNRIEDLKLSPIEEKIQAFLIKNPKPKDKAQFHKFAESKLGMDESKAEEVVYSLLARLLKE